MASNLRRSKNSLAQRFMTLEENLNEVRATSASREAVASQTAKAAIGGAPALPTSGQLWFDSTENKIRLKVYTGAAWKIIGGDMPRISCRHSGLVSVANNTATVHPWDKEDENFDITHSETVNSGRFTIPTGFAGRYAFAFSVIPDNANDLHARAAWVDVNVADTTIPTSDTGRRYGFTAIDNQTAGNTSRGLAGSGYMNLSEGDVVRVKVYQNSGSTQNFNLTNRRDIAMFQMWMIDHKVDDAYSGTA